MTNTVSNQTVAAAKAGDQAAATNIVLNMQSHIARWANAISGKYHVEETTLEGTAALWEAVLNFDDSKGASFYTHARRVIRLAMLDSVSKNNDGPTVHERTARRYFALVREADGDIAGAAALAAGASSTMTPETFWAAHNALDQTERFDDRDPRLFEDSESTATLVVSMRDSTDVEATAIDNVVTQNMLESLTARQANILERTYGLNGYTEQKDNDIATALNISRPRVVTIRKAALAALATTNKGN